MRYRLIKRHTCLVALVVLAACSAPRQASNIEPVASGGAYQAQYRDISASRDASPVLRAAQINASKCLAESGAGEAEGPPGSGAKYAIASRAPAALRGEMLTRGDLLDFRLPDETIFSGEYVISRDGRLKLPYVPSIQAQGRTTEQVRSDISDALVETGFYDSVPDISLLVMDFASVRVGVSGAVFEPQPVQIGGIQGDQLDARRQSALGASTEGRNLSAALRAAGGIRPDADLSSVRVSRGGQTFTLDLRGATEGRAFDDIMLVTGDAIYVPSLNCFQDILMSPSPISPPGVSLYLSNLTIPSDSNSRAAIGQTVREVPYGTRFMQAVIDTNCVGGARATSADRYAALFSRNPITDVSVVIDRPVEVMRTRADRDDYDPYLLPGDAIACYDSSVTNLTEVARLLGLAGAVAIILP